MSPAWTEHDFDHERDHAKNWLPHSDPIPLRLQPRLLSTAMDVALIVRGMSNLYEAGKLIDAYADAKAAEQRLEAVAAGANS